MISSGYDAQVISGTRTFAEQNALYAQGRTTPGDIVTKSRAGESNHNFGVAFDIGLFKNRAYRRDGNEYFEVAPMGKSRGLEWGGNFKSIKDYPHYQYPTGFSPSQMRDRMKKGLPVIPSPFLTLE